MIYYPFNFQIRIENVTFTLGVLFHLTCKLFCSFRRLGLLRLKEMLLMY